MLSVSLNQLTNSYHEPVSWTLGRPELPPRTQGQVTAGAPATLSSITWLAAPGAAPPWAWRHSHTLRQEHPRQPQPQWLGAQWHSESQRDHCSVEGEHRFPP